MGEVEIDVRLAVHATPFVDLGLFRPGDDVAGRQLHLGLGVLVHEPLALAIVEQSALAAGCLGDENPVRVDAGRVELDEFHVLERQASTENHRKAVACVGVGVRRDLPGARVATGRKQRRLGVEDVEPALLEVPRHQTHARAVLHDQLRHIELVVETDPVLHALLVERVQLRVPRAVGGIAGTRDPFLSEVRVVTAEWTLRDLPIGRAGEGKPEVLHLVDCRDRLAHEDLLRVLIAEVVAAAHRVVEVPLPAVVLHVAERGGTASLGRARVGTGRVDLRDHGRVEMLARLQGRVEPGDARAHDDHIMPVSFRCHRPLPHRTAAVAENGRIVTVPRIARSTPSARTTQ